MDKKQLLLLKTLLTSTSRLNKYKYSNDKKVKSKALGGMIGVAILYLMVIAYSFMACYGYGYLGLAKDIPVICASSITMLVFFFTFFKTNGYLFAFKEYDMLMSLPFSPKTIAADKFLYMYIMNLPWCLSLSFAMMVSYGIFMKPCIIVYLIWIILTIILPIIPMVIASFIGYLIAKVSSGFKHKNIIQTVLIFIFVIFSFSIQYIIEALVKNDDTVVILENVSMEIQKVGDVYLPIKWFNEAIGSNSIISAFLLVVVTIIIFEVIFTLVGRNYREINSKLKSNSKAKAKKKLVFKKMSVVNSLAFKEFKRLTGTQTYLVNGAMGEVLTAILGIAGLIFSFDSIIKFITKGAPFDSAIVYPAIPLIVYFLIGMVATTACSPSLEGKNYWILQSLPIEKKTIYQGKILFNIYLTVPFALFATLSLSFSARVPLASVLIYILEIVALCLFSSTWGCVCGMRHRKLDWENEIEVVKQGAAVAIYLLPNMFVTMGLVVLVVFLGLKMNTNLVSLIVTAIALLLALLSYLRVIRLANKLS